MSSIFVCQKPQKASCVRQPSHLICCRQFDFRSTTLSSVQIRHTGMQRNGTRGTEEVDPCTSAEKCAEGERRMRGGRKEEKKHGVQGLPRTTVQWLMICVMLTMTLKAMMIMLLSFIMLFLVQIPVRSIHQWDSKPCHRKSTVHATHAIEYQRSGASKQLCRSQSPTLGPTSEGHAPSGWLTCLASSVTKLCGQHGPALRASSAPTCVDAV